MWYSCLLHTCSAAVRFTFRTSVTAILAFSNRARSAGETAAERGQHDEAPALPRRFVSSEVGGLPEHTHVDHRGRWSCRRRRCCCSSCRCFQSRNPAARCLQCSPSLLQRSLQLLQSFFRRSHRDTIPEQQTNAVVAQLGSATVHRWPETRTGETCVTTLFHSDTDSVSQPNGMMCKHDDARQSTMSKCPQDDDYPTSSARPLNRTREK